MMYSLILIIAATSGAAAAVTHHGDGTAYSGARAMDATGQNMCEFNPTSLPYKWQVFYGAMNRPDWNSIGGKDAICGKCVAVRGVPGQTTPGFDIQTVYVKIVDQCPECASGSIDFSTTALQAITGYSWDRKSISWEYVDCPSTPNVHNAADYAKAMASGAYQSASTAAGARRAAAKVAATKHAAAAKAAAAKHAAAAAAKAAAKAQQAARTTAAAEKQAVKAAAAAAKAAQAAGNTEAASSQQAAKVAAEAAAAAQRATAAHVAASARAAKVVARAAHASSKPTGGRRLLA